MPKQEHKNMTKLICPTHGVIKEFDYNTFHIGDPLKDFTYCPKCGKRLDRMESDSTPSYWIG